MPDKIRRWIAQHPNWTLTVVTLAALAPFLAKPFNIDDPLFVWIARQIQLHPGNPYGFDVNWYGEAQPMWSVTENPPLACYFMALAAKISGWSEIGLHAAFLIPAIAVVLGTRRLAGKFCGRPLFAALATLFTPVFLVSATTVMCDVPMLAFWIWAVVFWIEGMERGNFLKLFCAVLFIALAAMTKYFGACLIPLLAAHGIFFRRKFGSELFLLLIPLAVLCAYEWATRALYGHALLSEATDYAQYAQGILHVSKIATGLIALTFAGGCLAVATFFAPLLWRPRMLAAFGMAAVLIAAVVFATGMMSKNYPWLEGMRLAGVELQMIFWTFGGISILTLAVVDFWERRDARSCLLILWILGTFLFTAVFNWTVNARSILPMTPALGILMARRLEKTILPPQENFPAAVPICLAVSAGFGLLIARADFCIALADCQSARQVVAKYDSRDSTLWFEGHWGFQFYMDELGASELDVKHSAPKPGDRLVLPLGNTSLFPPDSEATTQLEPVSVPGPRGLTTWNGAVGAGFYASSRGPLPFAFGYVPPEKNLICIFKTPVSPPPQKQK
jgi:4-amino-4-deoxy-L-arabinose transferase-like glycosyltransferase